MRKLHIPRVQLKVRIPKDLRDEVHAELALERDSDEPVYGDIGRLIIVLLKKWVQDKRARRAKQGLDQMLRESEGQ